MISRGTPLGDWPAPVYVLNDQARIAARRIRCRPNSVGTGERGRDLGPVLVDGSDHGDLDGYRSRVDHLPAVERGVGEAARPRVAVPLDGVRRFPYPRGVDSPQRAARFRAMSDAHAQGS